jgi:purine-binding chemotaxis protein CheW
MSQPLAQNQTQGLIQRSPALKADKPSTVLVEVCSIRAAQTQYGVPIAHILEIVGNAHPQEVPLAPPYVGGLVHYRGDVLTTVSLRRLLGLPGQSGRQDILVLESSSGCFGLLVDSVGEVLRVSSADHEPNPSVLDPRRGALFAGAYKLKDGLLIMLDPLKLDPDRLDGRLDSDRQDPATSATAAA